MLNLPLADDRVALRVVGFAAEDAGYIDNCACAEPGRNIRQFQPRGQGRQHGRDDGGRERFASISARTSTRRSPPIYQDINAKGHSDVTPASDSYPGVRDLQQVRFEHESMDDSWYQLGLTLNARTSIGDLVVFGFLLSTAISSTRRMRRITNSISTVRASTPAATESAAAVLPAQLRHLRFWRRPRGFATNDEQTQITTFEARLQSKHAESRWSWLAAFSTARRQGHTEFNSYIRKYADTDGSSRTFATLQYVLQLDAAADERLVPGHLRHGSRAAGRVRRSRLRRHRQLHDHRRRQVVRVRPQVQAAPGIAAGIHRLSR
jgi:hypothetical protein